MNEEFPLALPPGTILAGQFCIEKVLGQGGFGITYSAADHTSGQRMAIKEYFPDTLAYREKTTVVPYPGERAENYEYGKSGFLEEAKTLAEFIGNENIVRIYTYFEENGTAYFAMEYIEGVSFEKYLKDHGGKIPFDDAKRILVPIMDALAAVHSKGIVHRDVTPDNIYITNDNKIKLLDFGAARYSLGDKSRSLDVILKHGFAPKEQYMRRGRQGPFTDVYSLGATFYFALTGRRPPDAVERMEEDTLIPPTTLGAKLTEYEESAILQALQINSGDRFQNMIAFRNVMLGENAFEHASQPEPQQMNGIVSGVPGMPAQPVNTYTQQNPEQPAQPVQQPVEKALEKPAEKQKKSSGKTIAIIAISAAVVVLSIAAAIIIPSLNSNVDTSKGDKDKTTTSVTTDAPEDTTTAVTTTTTKAETTTQPPETTATAATTTAAAPTPGDASTVLGNTAANIHNFGHCVQTLGSDAYITFMDYYENKDVILYYKSSEDQFYEKIRGFDYNLSDLYNLCYYNNKLYFIADGYIYCSEDIATAEKPSITKLLTNDGDGHIKHFYYTNDYLFYSVYLNKTHYLYRYSLNTGEIEEQLQLESADNFILVNGYFYVIGTDGENRSTIFEYSATDFNNSLNYIRSNDLTEKFTDITSDGKNIYAYTNKQMLLRSDLNLTQNSINTWGLSDILGSGGSLYGLNIYNDKIYCVYNINGTCMPCWITLNRSDNSIVFDYDGSCPYIVLVMPNLHTVSNKLRAEYWGATEGSRITSFYINK